MPSALTAWPPNIDGTSSALIGRFLLSGGDWRRHSTRFPLSLRGDFSGALAGSPVQWYKMAMKSRLPPQPKRDQSDALDRRFFLWRTVTSTETRWEYFVVSFVPNILDGKSVPVGGILREVVPGETGSRYVAAKFTQAVDKLNLPDQLDRDVVEAAIAEITRKVERARDQMGESELDVLLQELTSANTGICASEPRAIFLTGTPETMLNELLERETASIQTRAQSEP